MFHTLNEVMRKQLEDEKKLNKGLADRADGLSAQLSESRKVKSRLASDVHGLQRDLDKLKAAAKKLVEALVQYQHYRDTAGMNFRAWDDLGRAQGRVHDVLSEIAHKDTASSELERMEIPGKSGKAEQEVYRRWRQEDHRADAASYGKADPSSLAEAVAKSGPGKNIGVNPEPDVMVGSESDPIADAFGGYGAMPLYWGPSFSADPFVFRFNPTAENTGDVPKSWREKAAEVHDLFLESDAHDIEAGDDEEVYFIALGLAGEVGELCNLLKKSWRGDTIPITDVQEEMADVRIYLEHLATVLGVDLDDACDLKATEVLERWKQPA